MLQRGLTFIRGLTKLFRKTFKQMVGKIAIIIT